MQMTEHDTADVLLDAFAEFLGKNVSDAAQAYEATRIADGVIQGASVVRRLMESGPDAVGDYVAEVRASIDRP